MVFVRPSGVTGMKQQAVDGRSLPRYRPGPRDYLQLAYFFIAVLLVGFIGLFAFGLVFNEVTLFGWLFAGGFLAFRHGFIQYRNRLAVSGTATAKASSAAIGLAELSGRGHADDAGRAPVSETTCLFWSVEVHQWQRRSKRHGWNRKLHNEFRVETLELEDASGRVLVWTHGAELVSVKQIWRSEDGAPPDAGLQLVARAGLEWPERSSKYPMKITEERILSNAPLYVMGTLAERRQIPEQPTSFWSRLLHRWSDITPGMDGQSFVAMFRFVSQGARRWLARDLQQAFPKWAPPDVDPHRVVVWKGDQRRPFLISGLMERDAMRALSRRAWAYILGGGALMAGTLLVSIWKLTDVIR
jgi:hypothetical protein